MAVYPAHRRRGVAAGPGPCRRAVVGDVAQRAGDAGPELRVLVLDGRHHVGDHRGIERRGLGRIGVEVENKRRVVKECSPPLDAGADGVAARVLGTKPLGGDARPP